MTARILMGCVTDKSFHKALLEQYPNRKPGHPDEHKRKKVAWERRDEPELMAAQAKREHLRFFMDEVKV